MFRSFGIGTGSESIDWRMFLSANLRPLREHALEALPVSRDLSNRAAAPGKCSRFSKPNHIPAHEAYCRFLDATNQFSASLVACARALSLDPWNGIALYHLGLAQLQPDASRTRWRPS